MKTTGFDGEDCQRAPPAVHVVKLQKGGLQLCETVFKKSIVKFSQLVGSSQLEINMIVEVT